VTLARHRLGEHPAAGVGLVDDREHAHAPSMATMGAWSARFEGSC
jgi:hypothetical protein